MMRRRMLTNEKNSTRKRRMFTKPVYDHLFLFFFVLAIVGIYT
jgi:hypothetical protein